MVISKGFWNFLFFSFISSIFIVCKSTDLKGQRSMILFFYYKQRVLLRSVRSSVCIYLITVSYIWNRGRFCHSFGKNFSRKTNIKATMFMATFTFPFGRTNCVVGNRVDGNIAEKVRVQSSRIRAWCSCYLNNRIHSRFLDVSAYRSERC